MSCKTHVLPEVVDPTPSQGLDPGAGAGESVTETSPLLSSRSPAESSAGPDPNADAEEGSLKDDSHSGHYRNIDEKHFWWCFAGIVFGMAIAFFDSSLMASSHPTITSYFNASNSASWLSTVFFLTSTIFQPIFGRVSDTIGRRPVYLFAITVFFVTTLWCALAQSISSFIIGRAFCGIGAGGVISTGFVIVSDIVKIEYRGLYQSYMNIAYGFGNSLGAAMGGLLCDRLGWRGAFGVQLPFIFTYLILAFFTTPRDLGPNFAKSEGKGLVEAFKTFDKAGSACLTVAVSCLILGINLGGNVFPWSSPVVISSLALFGVSAIALVVVERKAVRPILPMSLLSTTPIANLVFSNLFGAMVTVTVLFNAPLFFQGVRQESPTASGLYLISPLVAVSVSSVVTGFYITWSRRLKAPMVIGVLFMLAGATSTACLTKDMPAWAVLAMIPETSLGQGFLFPTTTITVLALSSQDDQAVVTTTLGLLRNLGAVMGVAISSWVLQNALVVFLNKTVTGSTELKQDIIQKVRKSVKEIARLDAVHKAQVIDAYSQALRATFSSGILFAVLVVVLILPIRLPRLQKS